MIALNDRLVRHNLIGVISCRPRNLSVLVVLFSGCCTNFLFRDVNGDTFVWRVLFVSLCARSRSLSTPAQRGVTPPSGSRMSQKDDAND